jgi:hypothetical protein
MILSRKLPARFNGIVMPLILSLMMCFVVSGISTARAVGIAADLPERWLQPWCLSWLVAFPTLLLVMPTVRRITGLFVEAPRG